MLVALFDHLQVLPTWLGLFVGGGRPLPRYSGTKPYTSIIASLMPPQLSEIVGGGPSGCPHSFRVCKTLKTKNRAGQAFRMAAQAVKKSDCVFDSFYRRLRSRLDKAQATAATAHMIARVVYRMLKYKVEYEMIDIQEYEAKYKKQQIKYMRKKAAKLGFQLAPAFRPGRKKKASLDENARFAFKRENDFRQFHASRWKFSANLRRKTSPKMVSRRRVMTLFLGNAVLVRFSYYFL